MSASQLQVEFRTVVENVFNRWTALRLAVEHGMGGPLGLNTAIEFIDYATSYCTENKNVDCVDLREVLEEIMDQEFETICEDDSIYEISTILIKLLTMLKAGKGDDVRAEIARMAPCELWIKTGAKITYCKDSSDSDEDDFDEEMEVEPSSGVNESSTPSKDPAVTGDVMEENDEPGWTSVRGRRRR